MLVWSVFRLMCPTIHRYPVVSSLFDNQALRSVEKIAPDCERTVGNAWLPVSRIASTDILKVDAGRHFLQLVERFCLYKRWDLYLIRRRFVSRRNSHSCHSRLFARFFFFFLSFRPCICQMAHSHATVSLRISRFQSKHHGSLFRGAQTIISTDKYRFTFNDAFRRIRKRLMIGWLTLGWRNKRKWLWPSHPGSLAARALFLLT